MRMNKFSKDLLESLTEACEHAKRRPSAVRVHVIKVPEHADGDDQRNAAPTARCAPRRMG
jgi:hypothetical protein